MLYVVYSIACKHLATSSRHHSHKVLHIAAHKFVFLLCRGIDPFGAAPTGALQQAYPGGEASGDGLLIRPKTTRRTFPPRHIDGDEDYNSADGEGKGGRKRRYRVAEVRGSWSPDEDSTLMQ